MSTFKGFIGLLKVLLEEIHGLYQQHHQPCFLYLSSEVIKIFGSDPSCANYLRNLIEALFSHTTHLLTKIKDFTARPDITDDCFLLASRCIRYCPHLFVASVVFPSLVDCAMIGITIQHREACNSVLTFLSDVFDLANSSRGEQYKSTRDAIVVPRGPSLSRILIASLTGALPSSRLEVVTYTLLALTRAYVVLKCWRATTKQHHLFVGPIFGVCYDWSKGAKNHNPSTAKSTIFLHLSLESEVKGKPRVGTGRK